MQHVIVKVYGHIHPVDDDLYAALSHACVDALAEDATQPVVRREGDMALMSLEGMYFPVEEVLAVIAARLTPKHKGKLDVLDLEGWRLTRHLFVDGRVQTSTAPLNTVLAHSGH